MKLKTLQILMVIAAVLCAVGIFAGLGGGSGVDADNFQPPAWLKAMGGLAGGPRLTAKDLTNNGVAWKDPLALGGGTWRQFSVSSADDEVRRVAFRIKGPGRDGLTIRYQPKSGQRLHGEEVEAQGWPNEEKGEPNFVVYDRGGTFVFRNAGPNVVEIRLED